jgi:hypothetical protein
MERDWSDLVAMLRDAGVIFAIGLSDIEIAETEQAFQFRFPPDLRAFLQTALPADRRFPNWRSGDEAELHEWLGRPMHGFLFDVEHSEFWLPEWGERPAELSEAFEACRKHVNAAPKLIPIFAHRYIPERPSSAGNPVFSVYQTDIIWYGFDLDDYLRHEFKLEPRAEWPDSVRQIDFWDPERFQNLRCDAP